MRLTLVRHGETDGQSSIRYYGRTDVPLSDVGRVQMERVGAALAPRRFAAVYSSTLSRATEAARIIGGAQLAAGGVAVTPVGGFDEIDFGAWEGLTAAEIRSLHPVLYGEWQAQRGEFVYPGGESGDAFRARVVRTLRQVLAQAPPGELLFVVHKGVIRCVLAELLGFDELQRRGLVVALGSIHILARDRGAWRAEALDRTDHL